MRSRTAGRMEQCEDQSSLWSTSVELRSRVTSIRVIDLGSKMTGFATTFVTLAGAAAAAAAGSWRIVCGVRPSVLRINLVGARLRLLCCIHGSHFVAVRFRLHLEFIITSSAGGSDSDLGNLLEDQQFGFWVNLWFYDVTFPTNTSSLR